MGGEEGVDLRKYRKGEHIKATANICEHHWLFRPSHSLVRQEIPPLRPLDSTLWPHTSKGPGAGGLKCRSVGSV